MPVNTAATPPDLVMTNQPTLQNSTGTASIHDIATPAALPVPSDIPLASFSSARSATVTTTKKYRHSHGTVLPAFLSLDASPAAKVSSGPGATSPSLNRDLAI